MTWTPLPAPADMTFEQLISELDDRFEQLLGYVDGEAPAETQTIQELRTEILALIAAARVYDQAGFVIGLPTAGARLFLVVAVRPYTIPENCVGSYGKAAVAPTASAEFTLKKNGVSFGTMTFDAGLTTAEFVTADDVSFEAGDVLEVVAPAVQDVTLADVCWNLKALFSEEG